MVDGIQDDDIKISFHPTVELLYLNETEQTSLLKSLEDNEASPILILTSTFKFNLNNRQNQKNYGIYRHFLFNEYVNIKIEKG